MTFPQSKRPHLTTIQNKRTTVYEKKKTFMCHMQPYQFKLCPETLRVNEELTQGSQGCPGFPRL